MYSGVIQTKSDSSMKHRNGIEMSRVASTSSFVPAVAEIVNVCVAPEKIGSFRSLDWNVSFMLAASNVKVVPVVESEYWHPKPGVSAVVVQVYELMEQ